MDGNQTICRCRIWLQIDVFRKSLYNHSRIVIRRSTDVVHGFKSIHSRNLCIIILGWESGNILMSHMASSRCIQEISIQPFLDGNQTTYRCRTWLQIDAFRKSLYNHSWMGIRRSTDVAHGFKSMHSGDLCIIILGCGSDDLPMSYMASNRCIREISV